jgi:hypothetical protein
MRAIQKQGSGGYHLQQAHASPPKTSGEATSRWSSFRHKASVMQYLLNEQNFLCCYSELRADQEGLSYHIEHVENKSTSSSTIEDERRETKRFAPRLGVFRRSQQHEQMHDRLDNVVRMMRVAGRTPPTAKTRLECKSRSKDKEKTARIGKKIDAPRVCVPTFNTRPRTERAGSACRRS